ncbi:hypothetical protein PISMIDRAFT_683477, partial [Pisolithus microcarpus 441]
MDRLGVYTLAVASVSRSQARHEVFHPAKAVEWPSALAWGPVSTTTVEVAVAPPSSDVGIRARS